MGDIDEGVSVQTVPRLHNASIEITGLHVRIEITASFMCVSSQIVLSYAERVII